MWCILVLLKLFLVKAILRGRCHCYCTLEDLMSKLVVIGIALQILVLGYLGDMLDALIVGLLTM